MTSFIIDANEAFDNFDELVSAINDWMDRSDLTAPAPQMIAMAEDEMRIRLEPFFLEVTTSLTSDSTGFAALPADAKSVKRVFYDKCSVPQRGVNSVDRMTDDTTQPWAYTMEQGGIRLWPAAAHTVDVLYQPILQRLTSGSPSNNLLDLFPSLYFYGAMTFACAYVKDDERAGMFRRMFDMMIGQVEDYYKKQSQGGPMVARVAFVP